MCVFFTLSLRVCGQISCYFFNFGFARAQFSSWKFMLCNKNTYHVDWIGGLCLYHKTAAIEWPFSQNVITKFFCFCFGLFIRCCVFFLHLFVLHSPHSICYKSNVLQSIWIICLSVNKIYLFHFISVLLKKKRKFLQSFACHGISRTFICPWSYRNENKREIEKINIEFKRKII